MGALTSSYAATLTWSGQGCPSRGLRHRNVLHRGMMINATVREAEIYLASGSDFIGWSEWHGHIKKQRQREGRLITPAAAIVPDYYLLSARISKIIKSLSTDFADIGHRRDYGWLLLLGIPEISYNFIYCMGAFSIRSLVAPRIISRPYSPFSPVAT